MEKLAVEELNNKYNLGIKIWDLITSDIFNDGLNLCAIYEVKKNKLQIKELYYVRAYFTDKKAYIFSCDKFVKEQN
jgi:hypothetical protein